MLKEYVFDTTDEDAECKKALGRLNKTVSCGYFKLKEDGNSFVIIKYTNEKAVDYVLGYAESIVDTIRVINIAYRVIGHEVR